MTYKKGSSGAGVRGLQKYLLLCGFPVGELDSFFGPAVEAAVLAFQKKYGLLEDGLVGPRTIEMLTKTAVITESYMNKDMIDSALDAFALPALPPQNSLDYRISNSIKLMQTCDGGQGCRYGGWTDPYQFEKAKFKEGDTFPIPKVGRITPDMSLNRPAHGGTCSPWAGLYLGWYLCVNEDFNFRIGRNARWIATWKHDHVYKDKLIPGYGDYTEVNGVLRLEHHPLNSLYTGWDWLNKINIIEMSHHIILVLKVGGEEGLHLEAPDGSGPVPSGLYRLGADGYYPKIKGKKFYSGTKQSFLRIDDTMKTTQRWDFYRVADVNPETCSPDSGPWANRAPRALVLS
jgi:hypothetical protein